jgi:hypothetical protein
MTISPWSAQRQKFGVKMSWAVFYGNLYTIQWHVFGGWHCLGPNMNRNIKAAHESAARRFCERHAKRRAKG